MITALSGRERIGVIGVLALAALGARFVWLTPQHMAEFVKLAGYWVMLGLTVAAGYAAARVISARGLWEWFKQQGVAGLVVVVLWVFLLVHEPWLLKVNYDEPVLMGISRSMHYEQLAAWQGDGKLYGGSVVGFSYLTDKRPVLFPFLVSLIHSVSGYRVSNVYILNGLLAGIYLFAVYRLGCYVTRRCGGLLFVALMAGVPLLAQNATGGGFDLLNVALIALLAVAVRAYVESLSGRLLALVVCIALLLANVRYESILYVIVPLVCWAYAYRRSPNGRPVPLSFLLIPLGVFPALASNGVFNGADAFFQMDRSDFWGTKNYGKNLEHAVAYLFDPDRGGTNSALIAGVGCIALVIFLLLVRRQSRQGEGLDLNVVSVLVLALILLANVVLIMGLGWGAWDDPLVSRFTLPFWFFMGWVIVVVCAFMLKDRERLMRWVVCFFVGYAFILGAADASSARATRKLTGADLLATSVGFLKSYDPGRRSLVLAGSAIPYINEGFAAICFEAALSRQVSLRPKLAAAVNLQLYDAVIAVIHYKRDAQDGAWKGDATLASLEGADVEVLKAYNLNPFNRIVVAKILRMHAGSPLWVPSSKEESVDAYQRRVYEMMP